MEKHIAIFMYEKRRRTYYARQGRYSDYFKRWEEPEVTQSHESMGFEEIIKVEIDNPPLKVDDYIYINKLNNKFRVYEVARSTNNEYVYYVDYCTSLIEDEATEKSKQEAEKLLVQYQKEYEIKKLQRKDEIYTASLNEKKWYQFWKK